MNMIDCSNMWNLGTTKTGGNVSYGYTSASTEYKPKVTYAPPDDIFYKGERFKIDIIDTAGDSFNGDTELTIKAHKVITFPTGFTGCSGTITIDDPTFVKKFKEVFNNPYSIKKIIVNPKKNATTVLWTDGTHTVVKRSEGDEPADIWSVVSYALAEKVYGSNSAFKREVKGKVERMKE